MSAPTDLHPHHEDHPEMISRASRRGLALFVIYFALYLAFILVNVFTPDVMTQTTIPLGAYELSLGGPNLAIVSGMGLIFAAILLSLLYMRLTRTPNATV
ncbi:MAG TPA: DUF485 domain-containing protein [Phycisphaerae bacterium]|jgi:hypothetical protein|nr:DUF485 domain-containing protein [Phycisphaerae bacterium]